MASVLSHPAVPLALTAAFGARAIPPRLAAVGVLCSALPDVDAIGFWAGVPYGSLLGHRGLTHSLLFAVVAAALASGLHRLLRASPVAVFLFVFVSTASHGVIDAMTTGGLGVAFFSPFANARYFLPWRPIAVSPIGVTSFFSEWGRRVLVSELRYLWLPAAIVGAVGFLTRRSFGRETSSH